MRPHTKLTTTETVSQNEAGETDPGMKYKFCTRTDVLGCHGLVGCLVSLARTSQVRDFMCQQQNLSLLMDVSTQEDSERAKLGMEGICYLIAMHWQARTRLASRYSHVYCKLYSPTLAYRGTYTLTHTHPHTSGGIQRLCQNLKSSSTAVSLGAAAALNTYLRDSRGRNLISPQDAEMCFNGLIEFSVWCTNELERSAALNKVMYTPMLMSTRSTAHSRAHITTKDRSKRFRDRHYKSPTEGRHCCPHAGVCSSRNLGLCSSHSTP